ncbi:MAG: GNVR domain-containing protein [Anaerolineales bacterium]
MDENRHYFGDEVDAREVIRDLLRGWPWIVVAGVVAGGIALALTFFLQEEFRTSATVVLTKPDVIFRFDPRIQSDLDVPSGEGVPELALSSGVVTEVIDTVWEEDDQGEPPSYEMLSEGMSAKVTGTILTLTAQDASPTLAAKIANSWAEILVGRLNDVYAPSLSETNTFEKQSQDALHHWQSAQDAFVAFQRDNRERIYLQRLTRTETALANALDGQQQLEFNRASISALRQQLAVQDPNGPTDLRQDLLSVIVAMETNMGSLSRANIVTLGTEDEILSLGTSETSQSVPFGLQLQMASSDLIPETVAEQMAFLDSADLALDEVASLLDSKVSLSENDILTLQGNLAQVREERANLEEERDLAREAYQTLARKSQENRLATADQETVARTASVAAVPVRPVSPKKVLTTLMAAAFGILIGALGVVLDSWWRQPDREEQDAPPGRRSKEGTHSS